MIMTKSLTFELRFATKYWNYSVGTKSKKCQGKLRGQICCLSKGKRTHDWHLCRNIVSVSNTGLSCLRNEKWKIAHSMQKIGCIVGKWLVVVREQKIQWTIQFVFTGVTVLYTYCKIDLVITLA